MASTSSWNLILQTSSLIVRNGTKVTHREVFDSSSGLLKVVACAGVGIDNFNLSQADSSIKAGSRCFLFFGFLFSNLSFMQLF